jgi:phosphoribosylformylglycinamidine cyclo-ligase
MLLAPTRLYVKPILPLLKELNKNGSQIRGLVHITGGGFTDNVPRVLPKHLSARIEVGSWKVLPIFQELRKRGRLSDAEMHRTFNNGIGLVIVASPTAADKVLRRLKGSVVIGAIVKGDGEVQYA